MLSHHLHDAAIDACFRSFEMLNTYEKVFSATFLPANAYLHFCFHSRGSGRAGRKQARSQDFLKGGYVDV